jgi:hypothetical protein
VIDLRVAFGPITASLEGDGDLAREVMAQLDHGARAQAGPGDPDLQILLLDDVVPIESSGEHSYHCGENLSFDVHTLRYRTGDLTVEIRDLFNADAPCRLTVAPRKTPTLRRALGKTARSILRSLAGAKRGMGLTEARANEVLSYQVLWFVLHAVLLSRKAAFLHGAVLELPGPSGLALVGTGGCGKTSTCFHLLADPRVRYLSEDFTIVGGSSGAYFSPKAVTLYASDFRGSPAVLEDYLRREVEASERRAWLETYEKGGSNSRRRVLPSRVLSADRLGAAVGLDTVLFLVRENRPEIEATHLEPDELVERCLAASMRELKTLTEMLTQISAVAPGRTSFPTVEELCERTRQVYRSAFVNARSALLSIPIAASPAEVVSFLRDSGWLPPEQRA